MSRRTGHQRAVEKAATPMVFFGACTECIASGAAVWPTRDAEAVPSGIPFRTRVKY